MMILIILLVWFVSLSKANESLMCMECKCDQNIIRCVVIPSEGALEGYIYSKKVLDISQVTVQNFQRHYWFVSQYIVTGFERIIYPIELQREYI
jgi:hypothetical protein